MAAEVGEFEHGVRHVPGIALAVEHGRAEAFEGMQDVGQAERHTGDGESAAEAAADLGRGKFSQLEAFDGRQQLPGLAR